MSESCLGRCLTRLCEARCDLGRELCRVSCLVCQLRHQAGPSCNTHLRCIHRGARLLRQLTDCSFVAMRTQVGVAFTALRSGHFVTVLLADDGVHRLPSLADMESLAERVLEAATGTHGVLSVYAH